MPTADRLSGAAMGDDRGSGRLAVVDDFRCVAASIEDREPLMGTAPTETAWLLLEHRGPWGRQAVAEARWPESVRAALAVRDDLRVQLVRRSTRAAGGPRVFGATATSTGFDVGSIELERVEELLDLELDAARPALGLPPYADPLWLVCTNGRRDRCCAELGRPVTAALTARWPEHTWETTHLGGHRFAGTLLALPSGWTLGRLSAGDAVAACEAVLRGDLPPERVRGRAGLSPAAQAAELAVRGLRTGPTSVTDRGHGRFEVATSGATYDVSVATTPGPARRQSCADERTKATTLLAVESLRAR